MNCGRKPEHSNWDDLVGLRSNAHQSSRDVDTILLQDEGEAGGYECIFCDKVFDKFERLEKHQEYHLIENEFTETVEARSSSIPLPKMRNMFPEITSLLVGKEQTKERGESDRNIRAQNTELEVRPSKVYKELLIHNEFKDRPGSQCGYGNILQKLKVREESLCTKEGSHEIESNVLESDTYLKDSSPTQIEMKSQVLGENTIKGAPSISVEGSNVLREGRTSAIHSSEIEPKVIDMEIQEKIASCGEELEIMYVRNLDNEDTEKYDGIADECFAREEADYYARTSYFANAGSTSTEIRDREVGIACGRNTSLVHSAHLKNGLTSGINASSCIIIEKEVDKTRSNTISQSQKQDSNLCCQICKKHFDNLQEQEKLYFTGRPFLCNVCSIAYKKEQLLISHQSVDKERPFICETCGKAFKRSDTLGIHRRTHLGLKCHKCEVCLKSYVSKFVLKRHQVVHTNERPFACDMCDRKFRLKYDLTLHKRRHFDDKPFACKECGKKFTNSGHVATHMLIHKNQRSFVCCECGKGFLRKEHLERHFSNVHVGDRNYACDTCEKRFKRLEVLKAHLLTHSGKGKFVCKYCGKIYTTKWNLQAHKMSRHKES